MINDDFNENPEWINELEATFLVCLNSSFRSQRTVGTHADSVLFAYFPQGFLLEVSVQLDLQIGRFDSRRLNNTLDLLAVAIRQTDGLTTAGIHFRF